MDLGNSTVRTPEAVTETETETQTQTPARIQQPGKAPAPPFSNGVLKRHAPLNHHPQVVVVTYKECLKNHAASLGGHALDGCGEFMPSPLSNPAEPASLKCAACGCHRNFHRRDPEEETPPTFLPALEYQPHHRHRPPPPRASSGGSPEDSPSPPPISSLYYPSAPHMLLALSHGLPVPPPDDAAPISMSAVLNPTSTPILRSDSRKRFRTKFTQYQKERMLEFSGKVGWKIHKSDNNAINDFCTEIGVDRAVFKVWMHNNKNTLAKKDNPPPAATATSGNGLNHHHYHRHDHHWNGADVKPSAHANHLHESTSSQALCSSST